MIRARVLLPILFATSTSWMPASTISARTREPDPMEHPVYELRQYTLHPGRRDALIDLFERHFIESQEAVGMQVLGHFRDLDHPDRFVWFRRFDSMAARGEALPAFYQRGAVWKSHREAANATMLDSDNVLLLREAWPGSGFAAATRSRAPVGAAPESHAVVVVTSYALVNPVDAGFVDFFRRTLSPRAQAAGAKLLAAFVSEESENNFPPLPVRPDHVLVWVAAFDDDDAYARYRAAIGSDPQWQRDVAPMLAQRLIWPADVRRLRPAARSLVQE